MKAATLAKTPTMPYFSLGILEAFLHGSILCIAGIAAKLPPRLTAMGFKALVRASKNDERIEEFVTIIKHCKLSPVAMSIPNNEYALGRKWIR
jgi:hypothetical protein